jgi:hypothetical protein
LVAFSVGHRYKTNAPNDRGALGIEADLAEAVLHKAEQLLLQGIPQAVLAEDEPILEDEVSEWAKDALEWVMAEGISDGTRPHDPVTREELWTMLYRAYSKVRT